MGHAPGGKGRKRSVSRRALALSVLAAMVISTFLLLVPTGTSEQDQVYEATVEQETITSSRSLPEQDLDYAIVTDSRFVEAFQPLADWKHSKGFRTDIFELNGSDGITIRYPGRDNGERIHNFLADLKDKNPNLQWVLLGGDNEIIPARWLFTASTTNYSYYDYRNFCYGDVYYSGLDSNWDNDQNGVFGEKGEEDFEQDIAIGRLPVSTVADVERVVAKIIQYESTPPVGGWQRSVLLGGALMDMPNTLDNPTTGKDEGYNFYKDNGREVCKKVKDDLPDHIVPFELYDYDKVEGKQYARTYDQLNRSNFKHYYDMGHSSVLLVGHGMAIDGDFLSDYAGMSGGFHRDDFSVSYEALVHYSDADILGSDGKLPLIYASACSVGNFTEYDDSNLETLVMAKQGAIGMIAATNETWRLEYYENDTSYGNWWLAQQFYDRLYNKDPRPAQVLGEVRYDYGARWNDPTNPHLTDVKHNNYFRTNRMAYVYLGDPEMKVWTDECFEMNITYDEPVVIQNKSIDVSILDEDGAPVVGAMVTIQEYEDDTTRIRGFTNSGGIVKLPIDINSFDEGPLHLIVYADNALLVTKTIELTSTIDLTFEQDPAVSDEFPTDGDDVDISAIINHTGITHEVVVNVTIDVVTGTLITSTYLEETINGSGLFDVNFTVQAGTVPSDISIRLDPNGEVLEGNETNNVVTLVVRGNAPSVIQGLPDIVLNEDGSTLDDRSKSIKLPDYATDSDMWPAPISYWLEYNESMCNVSIDEELSVQVVPCPDWHGTFNVTVWITDGAYSDSDEIAVTVNPVNDPPELPQLSNFTAEQGTPFSLAITASDVDDETLEFYSVGGLYNHTPDIHDPNKIWINFTPTNDDVGLHFTKIVVRDAEGLNTTRTIPIEVLNVNDPPVVITSGSYSKKVGQMFLLEIEIEDPDPEDRHIFFSDSDVILINRTTGVIEFEANSSTKGKHTVVITVEDMNGSRANNTITIEIKEDSGDPPVTLAFVIGAGVVILIITYVATVFVRRGDSGKIVEPSQEGHVPEYEEHTKESETPIQTIKRIGMGAKKADRDIYLDEDVDEVINAPRKKR